MIAIFIEPEGTLLTLLRKKKRLLATTLPHQPYCTHPSHCTLLFGDYAPISQWQFDLQSALATTSPFEVATETWQVFADDPLTSGGQTVSVRIGPTAALSALQVTIATIVGPHRKAPVTPHTLSEREPFASSLRRFGYPFVGDHWIPHFTVGSPRVSAGDPLLARLMDASPTHHFLLRSISIWQIDGDAHEKIDELALGPTFRRR